MHRNPSSAGAETWILDGHNLMYAVPALAEAQTRGRKQDAREAVIRRAGAFAARRRALPIVVFDGDSGTGSERVQGVEVHYGAGPGGADDRIVEIATERVARGERVLVVTRDRALKARLPGRARTQDPRAFWSESGPERSRLRKRAEQVEEKPGFYDPEIEAHFLAGERAEAARRKARRPPPRKRP